MGARTKTVARGVGTVAAFVVIPGAQTLVLVGAGLALAHGHALLAAAVLYAIYATWPFATVPNEVGYLVMAVALVYAHRIGEDTVFLLVASRPILHSARMAWALGQPRSTAFWERYFLGDLRRWRRLAEWWRARHRLFHLAAWVLAIGSGLGWMGTLWWIDFKTPSPLQGPYYVVLTILLALWMGVVGNRDTYTPPAPAAPDPSPGADDGTQSPRDPAQTG